MNSKKEWRDSWACTALYALWASGRKTEKFTVSVNIAAASKVTFELTYEELLKRHLGKYKMLIKVKPKPLVKQFQTKEALLKILDDVKENDHFNVILFNITG
ncbi:dipeptidase 1 [Platysternon megacephalum]|uniref:Dipeptidase 1 n=1 Tax=Platysternon megacephalum TaxID=55544 RepID=A0A4D9EBY0_9SAUR|nr:dipeptidase 1 [Platysternon megacephalum]